MIIAHELAHCDIFKNNVRFSRTNRNMVESMSAIAERIRQYEIQYGTEQVETFLDAVLAIQEHVDTNLIQPSRKGGFRWGERVEEEKPSVKRSSYDDLWDLENKDVPPADEPIRVPPHLEDWQ